MKYFPEKLQQKLHKRKATNSLRKLRAPNSLVDFSSNDYLGFSKNKDIFNNSHQFLLGHQILENGATGSRLLSGNHKLYNIVEDMLSNFHNSQTSLIFNSGYDANLGLFSSVPQRGDLILYDEYIHASIRDGIKLSNAKAHKFRHNNLADLEKLIGRHSELVSESQNAIYIVTESVFSMDGDSPDLVRLSKICKNSNIHLIIDEAHAIGVFGNRGEGLIQKLKLESSVFARIITFGKGMGCHGAAILGSNSLKNYLVNFSRRLIYTTALPPHSLATIHSAYNELIVSNNKETSHNPIQKLQNNIQFFKEELLKTNLNTLFTDSHSAIHCCIISGNEKVKSIAKKLQDQGFDVKPILSPTVPKDEERLRFCLHAYNSKKEISEVLRLLATFVH